MEPSKPLPIPGASVSDVLTAFKNLVTALNNASQSYMQVNGQLCASGITAATVVKASAGRVAVVSVIVAGGAIGYIYDANALGVTGKPLYVIPMTVGVVVVNLPASFGILVVPGTSQTVTVSYS